MGAASLYELYVRQVAAIVGGNRAVVVSLALKQRASAEEEEKGGGEGEDEEDMMAIEGERERFIQIMGLVGRCKVW